MSEEENENENDEYDNVSTEDGISPYHFTNVFVPSTDFLTVSEDVSKT